MLIVLFLLHLLILRSKSPMFRPAWYEPNLWPFIVAERKMRPETGMNDRSPNTKIINKK